MGSTTGRADSPLPQCKCKNVVPSGGMRGVGGIEVVEQSRRGYSRKKALYENITATTEIPIMKSTKPIEQKRQIATAIG